MAASRTQLINLFLITLYEMAEIYNKFFYLVENLIEHI